MRPILLPFLGWMAAACTEGAPPTPGGTRDLDPSPPSSSPCGTSPPPGQSYEGPTRIDAVVVFCEGERLVLDVCAIGWTSNAFARFGAAAVEEHDLASVSFDASGHWDQLLLELVTTGTYERSATTAWSCEDGIPDVAVLVMDLTGERADCATTGDPIPGTEGWGCRPL